MSHSSSIDIKYQATSMSYFEILGFLVESGWNSNDFGQISFLPLGDCDRFDWTSFPYSDNNLTHVLDVLRTKSKSREMLGINLLWQDTEIGGTFLLRSDHSLSFIANINRQVMMDIIDITDVSWYLPKLLKPLQNQNIAIEAVEWSEFV